MQRGCAAKLRVVVLFVCLPTFILKLNSMRKILRNAWCHKCLKNKTFELKELAVLLTKPPGPVHQLLLFMPIIYLLNAVLWEMWHKTPANAY